MPKPYSNCEITEATSTNTDQLKAGLDYDLFNLISNSSYVYSQQFCILQCYQQHVLEKCGCVDYKFLSLFKNQTICNHTNVCLRDFLFNEFFSNNYLYVQDKCLPKCPLECYETTLKSTSTTMTQLNPTSFLSTIESRPKLWQDFVGQNKRPLDSNTARESLVKFNIYYDSLSYKLSSETPQVNVVSLLASVGGNLSLFLGVSVFSLCEMAEVALEIYFIKFKTDRNKIIF